VNGDPKWAIRGRGGKLSHGLKGKPMRIGKRALGFEKEWCVSGIQREKKYVSAGAEVGWNYCPQ